MGEQVKKTCRNCTRFSLCKDCTEVCSFRNKEGGCCDILGYMKVADASDGAMECWSITDEQAAEY
jgi:hypothetical protein